MPSIDCCDNDIGSHPPLPGPATGAARIPLEKSFDSRSPGPRIRSKMALMTPERTAIVLVGFQNDYFDPEGILRPVVEDRGGIDRVREATITFLKAVETTAVTIIATAIQFTDDYSELVEPVGILKTIRDCGAFQRDGWGGRCIPELEALGDRILHLPGKRGLNAFSNTDLDDVLRHRAITHVVMAGVVTSVCIDSTGRSAHERDFAVTVLSDCTGGRTSFEQDFYCREIFPLYADVKTSAELVSAFTHDGAARPLAGA